MSKYLKDWLERVAWTAAQAALGVVIVEVNDLDQWWVFPIAAGLAGLKGLVAKKIGNGESASTVPSI